MVLVLVSVFPCPPASKERVVLVSGESGLVLGFGLEQGLAHFLVAKVSHQRAFEPIARRKIAARNG